MTCHNGSIRASEGAGTWKQQPGGLTYLLNPWIRFPLEKLTIFQPVKKVPEYYGTRRFITALTTTQHLSLSWATAIQPMPTQPTSWIPILILTSHLRLGLPSCLFPTGLLHRKPVQHLSCTPYVPHDLLISCKEKDKLCSVMQGSVFGWIIWRAVNTTMNRCLLYTLRNALTSWTTTRISKISVPWSLAVQVIYQIHTKLSVLH